MDGEKARLFGGADAGLRLANPISSDLDVMRPSILPNLHGGGAAQQPIAALPTPGCSRSGRNSRQPSPTGQRQVAAGCAGAGPVRGTGRRRRGGRRLRRQGRCVRGCSMPAARRSPISRSSTDAPGWYHPGRSGALRLGPTVLAWFGEMHPAVLLPIRPLRGRRGFEVFLDCRAAAQDAHQGETAPEAIAVPAGVTRLRFRRRREHRRGRPRQGGSRRRQRS